MAPLVILISGKRYSGKNYVADILRNTFNIPDYSLAYELKVEMSRSIVNFSQTEFLDKLMKDRQFKEIYRGDLIELGSRRRSENIDYWCNKLHERISSANDSIISITDVRFPNEIEYFTKRFKCVTIRVQASINDRISRGYVESNADVSPSECSLDNHQFMEVIWNNNNASIRDLTNTLRGIIWKYTCV